MPLQIIVGSQWGDEGKGRIVDWFASKSHFVARYNGGDNAGHSVTVGERLFKLHLIPSGVIHPNPVAVLGNGMVINPHSLLEEMSMLRALGIAINSQRLRLSYAAHLITPAHQALDKALEASRGKDSIGTTGRGIGPAYTDKATRRGLRVSDLLAADLPERLSAAIDDANQQLHLLGANMLAPMQILEDFRHYAEELAPYVADTSAELFQALGEGKTVTAEAAQGTLLDIDHGTYPFVTSSTTTATGALPGLGLGITAAKDAVVSGVVKCFQTRVGSGPFPTEIFDETATRLRGSGANPWDEFGTTTGRPRRVGWLDSVLLRYASRINGLTELVITKLDVLSGLETLKICTGYKKGEETLSDLPFGPSDLSPYQPIYQDYAGWKEDIGKVRHWDDLPANARAYLQAISALTGLPIRLVSVGPEREQIIEIV